MRTMSTISPASNIFKSSSIRSQVYKARENQSLQRSQRAGSLDYCAFHVVAVLLRRTMKMKSVTRAEMNQSKRPSLLFDLLFIFISRLLPSSVQGKLLYYGGIIITGRARRLGLGWAVGLVWVEVFELKTCSTNGVSILQTQSSQTPHPYSNHI